MSTSPCALVVERVVVNALEICAIASRRLSTCALLVERGVQGAFVSIFAVVLR